jgi:hypothetical protein
MDDPEEVRGDLGGEISERDVLDRGRVTVAGVVDHDVESAETLDCCLDRRDRDRASWP